MKTLFRVIVDLNQGGTRVWYEEGKSAQAVQDGSVKILDNCLVDWKEVDVQPAG